MSFLDRLFGRSPARQGLAAKAAPDTQPPNSAHSQVAVDSQYSRAHPSTSAATRRELLRVVLRDTLHRHGIPTDWITADMLTATSRQRESGIHWRLSIRHWDPRFPVHCVSFQNSLITRVHSFDPMAETWLMGISWQFALADEGACPPMPHPGSWTAAAKEHAVVRDLVVDMPAGDVIAGPVSIDKVSDDVKADLERLMSALDAQYQTRADEKTQPLYAATQPARL